MIKVVEGFVLPCEIPCDEGLKHPDYYVIFWERRRLNGDGPEYRVHRAYRLAGRSSVAEAIEWEGSHADGRESATFPPAPNDDGAEEGLFLLHGSYSHKSEVGPEGLFVWELHGP